MKRIVISTFNNSNNNYGALFQSCALSSFLRDMGYDAYNITVVNRGSSNDTIKNILKKKLKRLLLLPQKRKTQERKRKMLEFSAGNQQQLVYENAQALFANPPAADVYLSGSDQVWNPKAFHEDFFLAYVKNGKKKISYAASMGHERIPDAHAQKFAAYIGDFDSISVREDSMIPIISKYTSHSIHQHLDPVFLLSRSEWGRFESVYDGLKYNKFILVYALEWTIDYDHELLKLKQQLGLPVVSINTGNIKRMCADQIIYNASPGEFLHILSRAAFVVSSSFHGTAMSIVYNKPFLAFCGKDKPTRVASLFRYLGISDRCSVESALYEIDYRAINVRIEDGRASARNYLLSNIEEQ